MTLAAVPYAQVQLPKINTILPTMLGAVVCFEIITLFVLYSQTDAMALIQRAD